MATEFDGDRVITGQQILDRIDELEGNDELSTLKELRDDHDLDSNPDKVLVRRSTLTEYVEDEILPSFDLPDHIKVDLSETADEISNHGNTEEAELDGDDYVVFDPADFTN